MKVKRPYPTFKVFIQTPNGKRWVGEVGITLDALKDEVMVRASIEELVKQYRSNALALMGLDYHDPS